jgi:hypothetical protein
MLDVGWTLEPCEQDRKVTNEWPGNGNVFSVNTRNGSAQKRYPTFSSMIDFLRHRQPLVPVSGRGGAMQASPGLPCRQGVAVAAAVVVGSILYRRFARLFLLLLVQYCIAG